MRIDLHRNCRLRSNPLQQDLRQEKLAAQLPVVHAFSFSYSSTLRINVTRTPSIFNKAVPDSKIFLLVQTLWERKLTRLQREFASPHIHTYCGQKTPSFLSRVPTIRAHTSIWDQFSRT